RLPVGASSSSSKAQAGGDGNDDKDERGTIPSSFAIMAISYKLLRAASSFRIVSTEGNILTGFINALASPIHPNKAVHRFFCIATLVLSGATVVLGQNKPA